MRRKLTEYQARMQAETGIEWIDRKTLLEHCYRMTERYEFQGMRVTARKIYYDLVSAAIIWPDEKKPDGTPEKRQYGRVLDTIKEGRECGEFPLDWLEDPLRTPGEGSIHEHQVDVGKGLDVMAETLRWLPKHAIHADRWFQQDEVVMVVAEKNTIAGVIERPCTYHKVPMMILRGYPSWPGVYAWYRQVMDLWDEIDWGCSGIRVLYLGDHDPDGMYIPVEMQARARHMADLEGETMPPMVWERVALTLSQAHALNAPSIGVKRSGARAQWYLDNCNAGDEAWEIEAMDAFDLRDLLDRRISECFDSNVHKQVQELVKERRAELIERITPDWVSRIVSD